MRIISNEVIINASSEKVFNFLSDCQNLYHILPQEKISDWHANENSCSFNVQKLATIALETVERIPNQFITLKSGAGSPFPFILNIRISGHEGVSKGFIEFDGQVNAFLKMIVEKPLTNLFDHMSNKLKGYFS
jgi:carbon monoxide dehydrogenase subunit G